MKEQTVAESSFLNSALNSDSIFPSKHYMPKEITQQSEFIKKYPTYDGRNTVIAIIDTGVDPSCPGLQKTTERKPKIIDCLDLTGAGDVDTSTIKKADENGILIGLTERELKIPTTWKNPSGEWHLGIKPIFELYSSDVLTRIKSRKKSKLQDEINEEKIKAMKELNEHEDTVAFSSTKMSEFDDREEIKQKLEQLKIAETAAIESPVADCIVWNDGEKWKACIDFSCKEKLDDAKVLSSFREDREYGYISKVCMVAYCITVHNDGNLLEICVPNGSHGTHVAHIAAGHFPDCPEKDGLAPGAQIISLCVGDNRKNEYLTHQALLRAIYKCIELKVDVINYSFGKPQNAMDEGNIAKLIKDAVEIHGIIFVTSAGNEGPGLTTIENIHHSMINVGAYLTAEMKESMYSHFEDDESVVFPFSSRGPCMDGTLGINISAPGAALTGISKHELMSSNLKNGTSMASPNAAGNIACILSGMKAESIPISSFRVKLALMNSAKMPEDGSPFCVGAGIIQILCAFEFIQTFLKSIPLNITDVKIDVNGKRGIYLREFWQTRSPQEFKVKIQTEFNHSKEQMEDIVAFECPITLQLSPGAEKFVKAPKYCRLPSSNFPLQIDPTCLKSNKVHFAEIIGINPENPLLGPLFRIPITVIIPEEVSPQNSYIFKKKLKLEPAIPQRLFIKSPVESTYANLIIKSKEPQKVIKFLIQRVYQSCNEIYTSEYTESLASNAAKYFYFSTPSNKTIEFCITQNWDNLGPSNIKVKIEFWGFNIFGRSLTSCNPTNVIKFVNNLRRCHITPSLEFTELYQSFNASEKAIIEPIDERNGINEKCKRYRLLLSYKLNVSTSASYSFYMDGNHTKFIDCTLIQVFTVSKKHVSTCYASKIIPLEIGDYIIRVQIRHPDPKILEKLQNSALLSKKTIPKITVNLFDNANSALKNEGTKMPSKYYEAGEEGVLYAGAISYPCNIPGTYLKGKLSMESSSDNSAVKQYSSFNVSYSLTCSTNNNAKNSTIYLTPYSIDDGSNDNIAAMDFITKKLKIAIRDVEIPYINKFENSEKAKALFDKLSTEFPKHLPIISAEIERLAKARDLEALKQHVEKLFKIADKDEFEKYYGLKAGYSEELIRQSTGMEKKGTAIKNALFLQANLMLDLYLRNSTKDIPKAFRYYFDPKIQYFPTETEETETEKIISEKVVVQASASNDDTVAKKDGEDAVVDNCNNNATSSCDKEISTTDDTTPNLNQSNEKEVINDIENNPDKSDNENLKTKNDETMKFKSMKELNENVVNDIVNDIIKVTADNFEKVNADDIMLPENDETSSSSIDKISDEKNETTSENSENQIEDGSVVEEENEKNDAGKKTPTTDEKETSSKNESNFPTNILDKFFEFLSTETKIKDSKGLTEKITEDLLEKSCGENQSNPVNNEIQVNDDIEKEKSEKDKTSNTVITQDRSSTNDLLKSPDLKGDVNDINENDKNHNNPCPAIPENTSSETNKDSTKKLNISDKTNSNISKVKDGEIIAEKKVLESDENKTEENSLKILTSNISLQSAPCKKEEEPSSATTQIPELIPANTEKETPLPLITLKEIEKVYREYLVIADHGTENAKTLIAKYHVAHGRFARALAYLQTIICYQTTSAEYLATEKAIIQLLEKLEWKYLAKNHQNALLIKHQKHFRPF